MLVRVGLVEREHGIDGVGCELVEPRRAFGSVPTLKMAATPAAVYRVAMAAGSPFHRPSK